MKHVLTLTKLFKAKEVEEKSIEKEEWAEAQEKVREISIQTQGRLAIARVRTPVGNSRKKKIRPIINPKVAMAPQAPVSAIISEMHC